MAATVVRGLVAASLPSPSVSTVIAVDTAFVAAQGSTGEISSGLFMLDNMVRNGSVGEGTLSLQTKCNAGSLVGFLAMPIDAGGGSDTVVIVSFQDQTGNVFTGAGHPVQAQPPGNMPAGSYWIGQAILAGVETYTIKIKVTVGLLQPVEYYVWWDAVINAS